jgi:hypothetical protein
MMPRSFVGFALWLSLGQTLEEVRKRMKRENPTNAEESHLQAGERASGIATESEQRPSACSKSGAANEDRVEC